jgi:hypothetical protein
MAALLGSPALANNVPEESASDWQVGDYWSYRVGANSIPYTLTYYVVARVDLLYKSVYALAEVLTDPTGKETISPLLVQTRELQPRPAGWPFPAERVPKRRAVTVALPRSWLPKEGGWQRVETTLPDKEGKLSSLYLLQGGAIAEVTVPAGTFRAVTLTYQRQLGQLTEEGQAWWSDQVGWWVRIEGTSHIQGQSTRYRLELSEWGRLEEEELTARLLMALSSTAETMPELARMVRAQLEEVGLPLD